MDDDCDAPLYLGVGSCHELAGRPRRKGKQPIGFVHFPDKPVPKKQPKPVAKKPPRPAAQKRRTRRK